MENGGDQTSDTQEVQKKLENMDIANNVGENGSY